MDAVRENAFEERLRVLREPPKAPPLPSLSEIWQTMKEVWIETGKAWDAEKTEKAAKNLS